MPRSRYAMVEDGPPYSPWYVGWANCDRKAAKVLRNYYERPTFLPEDSRDRKHILYPSCGSNYWISKLPNGVQ